jgi:hypothetical protein
VVVQAERQNRDAARMISRRTFTETSVSKLSEVKRVSSANMEPEKKEPEKKWHEWLNSLGMVIALVLAGVTFYYQFLRKPRLAGGGFAD